MDKPITKKGNERKGEYGKVKKRIMITQQIIFSIVFVLVVLMFLELHLHDFKNALRYGMNELSHYLRCMIILRPKVVSKKVWNGKR